MATPTVPNPAYPAVLLFGKTADGDNVPVLVLPDGSIVTSGGGGGTIGGSIAAGQVAVGSGADTISGSANLTFSGGDFIVTGNQFITLGNLEFDEGFGISFSAVLTDITVQGGDDGNGNSAIVFDNATDDFIVLKFNQTTEFLAASDFTAYAGSSSVKASAVWLAPDDGSQGGNATLAGGESPDGTKTGSSIVARGATDAANGYVQVTGSMQFTEQAAVTTPAANRAMLYARDNGSGKTQLCVLFPTGATQCFATEP